MTDINRNTKVIKTMETKPNIRDNCIYISFKVKVKKVVKVIKIYKCSKF